MDPMGIGDGLINVVSSSFMPGFKELDHLQRKKLLCEDEMTSLGLIKNTP